MNTKTTRSLKQIQRKTNHTHTQICFDSFNACVRNFLHLSIVSYTLIIKYYIINNHVEFYCFSWIMMINVLLVTTDHIVYYRMYIYWNDVYCTRKNRHFNFINTGLEQWASVVVLLDSVALIDGRFCDLNLRFANAIVGVLPIAKTFFLEKLKSILIVVYSHRRKKKLEKKVRSHSRRLQFMIKQAFDCKYSMTNKENHEFSEK